MKGTPRSRRYSRREAIHQQGGLAPVPDPMDSFRLIEAFEA